MAKGGFGQDDIIRGVHVPIRPRAEDRHLLAEGAHRERPLRHDPLEVERAADAAEFERRFAELESGLRGPWFKDRDGVRAAFPDVAARIDEELAFRSTSRVKERCLERLYERKLLTPKLYIKLRDEYEQEVTEHKHGN